MKSDPVVDRIREARRKIAEKYDHETTTLIQSYQELEKNA